MRRQNTSAVPFCPVAIGCHLWYIAAVFHVILHCHTHSENNLYSGGSNLRYANESTKVQNPRRNSYAGLTFNSSWLRTHTHYTSVVFIYCACAYECLGLRLYLACFTPVAPVASLEASFDPPVALHVAAAFRWSRNCAKAADGELQLICILAFSRHNS